LSRISTQFAVGSTQGKKHGSARGWRSTAYCLLLTVYCLSTACASAPKAPLEAPKWDAIPSRVVDALCRRLQLDAIATGRTAIVKVTQPLANPQSMAALAGSTTPRGAKRRANAAVTNRAIPIEIGRGACAWDPIDVRDTAKHSDAMLVELSAPLLHPFNAREAGVLARVSLGDQHQSLYWVSLVPRGDQWGVRFVTVLFE
jgi:hypothetical protein